MAAPRNEKNPEQCFGKWYNDMTLECNLCRLSDGCRSATENKKLNSMTPGVHKVEITQIATFEGSLEQCKNDANAFLKEHPDYAVVQTSVQPMWDYYTYTPTPQVCNQWAALVITYKMFEERND